MSILPLNFHFVFKKIGKFFERIFFLIKNKIIFDILQFCVKKFNDQFEFIT